MPKDYFDERIAEGYDSSSEETFEPAFVDSVVSFLADLAGDGGALEFGLGTGRIALPLSQRGVRVHGIVARLHRRRGVGTELVAVARKIEAPIYLVKSSRRTLDWFAWRTSSGRTDCRRQGRLQFRMSPGCRHSRSCPAVGESRRCNSQMDPDHG